MEADVSVETVPETTEEPVVPKVKRTKRPPEPDRGPFFTELWQGRPLYRCPVCRIAKTDRVGLSGDAAIRAHLIRYHQTQATPEQRARAAGLVITKR